MSLSLKIGAFVVAYKDEQAVTRIVNSLLNQSRKIDSILIIDNSPIPLILSLNNQVENPYVEKINFPQNLGISGALIEAQNWAARLGIDWLWMFDQDSEPEASALEKLLQNLESISAGALVPGILACGIYSASGELLVTGYEWREYRYVESSLHAALDPYQCDAVISSGSLIHVEKLKQSNRIEEKLFIDFVDFDLCRKLISKGFDIYVVPEAKMTHELGEPVLVKIPYRGEAVRYFHLSPVRIFHICRNQAFVEFSNSKLKYWPIVACNRIKHCLYFIQGALFSSPIKYRAIAAALVGLFFGFFSPKFWPEKYFRS